MSLEFNKLSRRLLSLHLRTNAPQTQNGNVLNARESENQKKVTPSGGEGRKEKTIGEKSRLTLSLLLIPFYKGMLLNVLHDFYRNISTKTSSFHTVFLYPSNGYPTECLDGLYFDLFIKKYIFDEDLLQLLAIILQSSNLSACTLSWG